MDKNFKTIINRIRFYIFLLGGFLGLEIPLFIFTYFKYFPSHRKYIWPLTFIIGILFAFIVYYIINKIIDEDYRIKLLFDSTPYDKIAEQGK